MAAGSRAWTRTLLLVAVVAALSVVDGRARGNPQDSGDQESGGITGRLWSKHSGDHSPATADNGEDGAYGHGWNLAPQEAVVYNPLRPGEVIVSKKQIRVWGRTPFHVLEKDAIPTEGGYAASALVTKKWGPKKVIVGKARIKVWYGGDQKINHSCYAHMEVSGTIEQHDPQQPIPTITATIDEGGWFTGLDSSNSVEWETAPDLVLRLNSTVAEPESGYRTFTYSLENLSGIARTFNFPEITSSTFPQGWNGVVDADDEVSLQVSAPESEGVYSQYTQAFTDDAEDSEHTNNTVVRVYASGGRITYAGTNQIQSAAYNPGTCKNVITFTVSSPATIACLYRNGVTGHELVHEVVGTFVPETNYTLEDDTFPQGVNQYRVATGIQTNYYLTPDDDVVEIEN